MTKGTDLITCERNRQIEVEGYNSEHDAHEKPGALTMAAICYASTAGAGNEVRAALRRQVPNHWPWEPHWWKPGQDDTHGARIRELTKAGALIAAEIDRLQAEMQRKGIP